MLFRSAELIMKYMLEAGHRRIAIVGIRSGKEGRHQEYVGTLRKRFDGYEKALKAYDLFFDTSGIAILESESTTLSGGKAMLKRIMSLTPQPTAIVTMSDIIAIGLMEQAKISGVVIPDQYSIAGFDYLPIARLITPSLTTISQPIRLKGKTAAEILVKLIQGEDVSSKTKLETKLIIRKSVKRITQE